MAAVSIIVKEILFRYTRAKGRAIRSEAVEGAPGVEEGAEVGLAGGADGGTAPGETVDKGCKLWGVGDSLVGETRPVEECPLNACIAYVESQIHLL